MNAIDRFVAELRAAVPAGSPEAERLENAFHTLQLSSDPRTIDEYDSMTAIAGQRLPLRERLRALLDLTEREAQ